MLSKRVLTVLSCILAGVIAAPAEVPPEKLQPTVIPIVSQSEELEPNGTYKFSYETGNGIIREETAYEKVLPGARDASSSEGGEDDDDSNEIHVQRGSYSYTAPDGTVISVSYIADENGFQPIGSHLPRSPVIAPASNSAEKSGRALKVADSSESASVPATAKVNGKFAQPDKENENPKPEDAPVETSDVSKSVAADEAKPESEPISAGDEVREESTPAPLNEENKTESVPAPSTEQNESYTTVTVAVPEAKSDTDNISTTETAEPKSLVTETEQSTTEGVITTTIASTSDASTATTANVDVSTEVTSTEASAQSTTESADQATTSTPVSTTSAEVSEQPSSTSAPESPSSSETDGPPTSTETVSQSPTEEVQQSSTDATEPISTEQPISSTTA